MGQKENNEIKKILLEAGPDSRLFRVNCGRGWAGKIISKSEKRILLEYPHPFFGMPEGTSDIIGWESIIITPDMIGKKIAVFKAVEVKTCGTVTTENQSDFIKNLVKMGGKGEIKIIK